MVSFFKSPPRPALRGHTRRRRRLAGRGPARNLYLAPLGVVPAGEQANVRLGAGPAKIIIRARFAGGRRSVTRWRVARVGAPPDWGTADDEQPNQLARGRDRARPELQHFIVLANFPS
jgi:hypothetical protein